MNNIWKKVTEETPQKGQRVLIAILHKYSNVPWEYDIVYCTYMDNDLWMDIHNRYSFMTPTHWIPIPNPPLING